jgi:type IV pilus assembly protein PilN
MSSKVISIEIGLHTTRICEVSYRKSHPHVYQCISYQTPENTFDDGYIRDKNKFVETAREKIREAKIKSNRVVFTVTSNKIASREVTIPLVKESRIQDVINANASEYFPIDISEYTISYSVLEKIVTKEEKKIRLLVLAAPNNLIKNYYNIADMLGLEVAAIDYMGNSNLQIIKKQVSDGTNLILHVNEQTTLISILEKNVLKLQRTISYGTEDIVDTLLNSGISAFKDEQELYRLLAETNLTKTQSRSLKQKENASPISDHGVVFDKQNDSNITEMIEDALKYLVNNILRVLDYYITQNQKGIDSIYLIGNGAEIKGIAQLIQQETQMEVKRLEELKSVIFNKKLNISKEVQTEYIFCIGASIHPIYFVPNEDKLKRKKHLFIHNMNVIFIGSCVISVILIGSSYLSYHTAQQENKLLVEKMNDIIGIEEIYHTNELTKETFEKLQELEDLTSNPNENFNQLLGELESKLPKTAIVEALNLTSTDITLSMKADSKETAAKVLQQLKTIPYLKEVTTNGITETANEDKITTVKFIINAKHEIQALQEEEKDE